MKKKRLLAVLLVATMILSIASYTTVAADYPEEDDIFEILTQLSDNYNSIDFSLKSLTEFDENTYDDMPMELFDPELLTDDEINAIMERIANGENVRFGTPSMSPYWLGGGPDPNKTHQWLTSNAFNILFNEQTTAYYWYNTMGIAYATQYSDWPDDFERDGGVFNGHFYYYPTASNYYGNYSPSAWTRFSDWYNDAVYRYKYMNDRLGAMMSLGCAIHYLSDVGSVPHTGDRFSAATPYMLIYHNQFETDANNWKSYYRITYGGHYNFANTSLFDILDRRAEASYSMYRSGVYINSGNSSNYEICINLSLVWTQRDIAGLLYKFYMDCR